MSEISFQTRPVGTTDAAAVAGNRALFASLGFCETIQHAHDGFDAPTWVEMEKFLS
jgi:hypothetical protein